MAKLKENKTFLGVLYTLICGLTTSYVMALYNKYLVYGTLSGQILLDALYASWVIRLPLALLVQYFIIQPIVGKLTEKHTNPTDNDLVKRCVRVGYTVVMMCPFMSLFSNVLYMFKFGWSFGEMVANWIPKMVQNFPFAFAVQVFVLQPLNKKIFMLLVRPNAKKKDESDDNLKAQENK